jgi:Ni,Fe-hydrogenase III large subunit
LIRDRDGAYGAAFIRRIRAMAIRDRPVDAVALAERICGEADRLDSTGVS